VNRPANFSTLNQAREAKHGTPSTLYEEIRNLILGVSSRWSQRLASNVDLEDVQEVELRDLQGVDDVITQSRHSYCSAAHKRLVNGRTRFASQTGCVTVRSTGKTTVGRALAHRLRGKFFLIDGTFIAGTGDFYSSVHRVFEAAKDNSPSVILLMMPM